MGVTMNIEIDGCGPPMVPLDLTLVFAQILTMLKIAFVSNQMDVR